MTNSRAVLVFENSIKSEQTRHLYTYCLKRFVEYFKLKNLASILDIEDKKLQEMVEDYLFHLKKNLKPNSIKPYFQALELLCVVNDKLGINFKKIHKMYPASEKTTGKKAWTTSDIQKMLGATTNQTFKTLILFLSSTGCRIGAVTPLRIKNLIDMGFNCMAVQFYEGTNEEYYSFLTPEASKSMQDYLNQRQKDGERLDKENPLFRKSYSIGLTKPEFFGPTALGMAIQRIIEKANLRGEKIGNRFEIMRDHGFRKRFNTILKLNKNINPAIAEKLIGHAIKLDGVYLTPTKEELFTEFQKAIPDLTIDDNQRSLVTIEQLKQELDEKEYLKRELDKMKFRLQRLEKCKKVSD